MHAHNTTGDADLTKRLERLRAAADEEAARILQESRPGDIPLEEVDAEIARARVAIEAHAASGPPTVDPLGAPSNDDHGDPPRRSRGQTALLDPSIGRGPRLLRSPAGWLGLAAALFVAFFALRAEESQAPAVVEGPNGSPVYMGDQPAEGASADVAPAAQNVGAANPTFAKFTGTVDFSAHVTSRPPFKILVIDVTRDVKIDDTGRTVYEVFDPQWSHDPTFDPPLPDAFRFEVHAENAIRGTQPLWQQLYSLP